MMDEAWEGRWSDSSASARQILWDRGYRTGLGEHPDYDVLVLSGAEDVDAAYDEVRSLLARADMDRDRALSPTERAYVRDWWSDRAQKENNWLLPLIAERRAKFVYIDGPEPYEVDRRAIGHGDFSNYVIVPPFDRALRGIERIDTYDVAVPASRLSIADLNRLTRPAQKAKRPRAR